MQKGNVWIIVLVIVVVIAVGVIVWNMSKQSSTQKNQPEVSITTVKFTCDDQKEIDATFHSDKVDLKLSDDRVMTLPEATSASGARYANADETIVFWNKGETAFITEKDVETFSNCIEK